MAERTVKKLLRSPQLIVAGTAQGALFLLIFRYVFGGSIGHTGSLTYVDYFIPGFVVTSVLFSGMGAATGIAEDLQGGLFDRLRSLPIRLLSIITGRVAADTSLLVWSLAVTIFFGVLVGFRTQNGPAAAAAAFGLCVVYGFAFCWLFIGLGLVAGSPQAAQGISFLVFPLSFVSSAYVPVSTMPGWMQAFANHQPLTYMSDTVRLLTEGTRPTTWWTSRCAGLWWRRCSGRPGSSSSSPRSPCGSCAGPDRSGPGQSSRQQADCRKLPSGSGSTVRDVVSTPTEPAHAHPYTLSIDVGGTGLKASVLSKDGVMVADRVKVETKYPMPPEGDTGLIAALTALVKPLPAADRVSCGFPGMVRNGLVLSAPHFVTRKGPGTPVDEKFSAAWFKFDLASALEAALGKPTKVANDADVQGARSSEGMGSRWSSPSARDSAARCSTRAS